MSLTGDAVERIHADARALFAAENLPEGLPAPRVTLDLPSTELEPFHVLVWGTARSFGVTGALTGRVVGISFRVRVSLIATGPTAEDAARVANAYLERALQLTLCDNDLGGAVEEVGLPQIVEADSWADDSTGRRHCGYLVEYEAVKYVAADPAVTALIGE